VNHFGFEQRCIRDYHLKNMKPVQAADPLQLKNVFADKMDGQGRGIIFHDQDKNTTCKLSAVDEAQARTVPAGS
jgi:hypothetical protein